MTGPALSSWTSSPTSARSSRPCRRSCNGRSTGLCRGIAGYIGRKAADIGHHLNVLEDSCLLVREPDVFRSGRAVYRIADPLITFYQVVMRPQWGQLESGRAELVWRDARSRFAAQVIGPHFERLCRVFAPAVPGEQRRLLSVGEVKWGETMGARHVERLRRARDLLAARGYDTRDTVLICYSGAGFEPDLTEGGERVRTVGLDDLYPDLNR